MSLVFPPLYAIMDAVLLRIPGLAFAQMLTEAGVTLIQYRDKTAAPRDLFPLCTEFARHCRRAGARFLVNDRPDLAALVGAAGVHVGQEDPEVESARRVCGEEMWVGVSTHTLEQVRRAEATSADYIAIGPVYPTETKQKADPVIGVELVREARKLTAKPLVAIGGIALERSEDVFRAGADSVAVARDLITAQDPAARARAYLELGMKSRPAGGRSLN
jgi:thiamine-phosphate pyrophosphorylase